MTEITYNGICSDAGNEYTITYRKVGETVTGKGIWDYYPHGINQWIPVRNPRIVRNLDAGKHPRADLPEPSQAWRVNNAKPNQS